jgi:hypothetical protein
MDDWMTFRRILKTRIFSKQKNAVSGRSVNGPNVMISTGFG